MAYHPPPGLSSDEAQKKRRDQAGGREEGGEGEPGRANVANQRRGLLRAPDLSSWESHFRGCCAKLPHDLPAENRQEKPKRLKMTNQVKKSEDRYGYKVNAHNELFRIAIGCDCQLPVF